MKAFQLAIVGLLIAILLGACEGPHYFSVTVIDKQTKLAVDSVFVQVKIKCGDDKYGNYDLEGYTDSLGKFETFEMIGTGLSPCKINFYMDYDKIGYIPKTEINKTEGFVELERIK